MFPDDKHMRFWLKQLDTYHPKNLYGSEVTYIPRDANLSSDSNFRDIAAKSRRIDKVSDNHLHFLSMLGKFFAVTHGGDNLTDGNHYLYLKNAGLAKLKDRVVNLLINEDETNYVSLTIFIIQIFYVSNVLNESREVQDSMLPSNSNKIHIIFNESNYSDFSKLDRTKIFLVFSKLNETQYIYNLQHVGLF